MSGLLCAEGYKLRKNKGFYVCALVMAATCILLYVMLSLVDAVRSGELENGTGGITVTVDGEEAAADGGSILEEMGMLEMTGQLFAGDFLPVMLAVFASIFVVGEYGSGMQKNIVGKGKSRNQIFLAKVLMTLFAEVLLVAIGVVSMLLSAYVFAGKDTFEEGWPGTLGIYIGQQILLLAALTAIFVLISEVCRNLAAAISLGIAVSALPVLFLAGVDLLCRDLPFTPSEYWIVNRSMTLPVEGLTGGDIAKNVVISLVWLSAAMAAGMWHFNRTDVR